MLFLASLLAAAAAAAGLVHLYRTGDRVRASLRHATVPTRANPKEPS